MIIFDPDVLLSDLRTEFNVPRTICLFQADQRSVQKICFGRTKTFILVTDIKELIANSFEIISKQVKHHRSRFLEIPP